MGLHSRLTALGGGLVLVAMTAGAGAAQAGPAAESLYVANTTDPVTVYDAGSSGAVAPTSTIPNPNITGTVWDPWTIAVDSGSNVYLQSYLSNADTFVYSPGSTGPPARVFRVTGPDSEGITVDSSGYEYVMGGEASPQITAAPPGASGSPAPVRQFTTDQDGFNPWPSTITVDGSGHLVVAVLKSTGNAIEIFQGGPTGSSTPIQEITGADTGLGSCTGLSTCDHISVAYSALTGDIYAGVSTTSGTHISEFAGAASGDAVPLRSISGSSTGLTGNAITGLAVSALSGDVYSMVKVSQFSGAGQVEVFGQTASGNISPVRTFTDAASGLPNAQGIALALTSPPPNVPETDLPVLLPLLGGTALAGSLLLSHRRRKLSRLGRGM